MNKKVASGLFWKLLENGGSQAVQFVVSVILARLLSPREYTVIAIIMIFTTIANVLVQNGFATALIQRKDADGVDFSSVFFLNLCSSLVVYIYVFAVACDCPVLSSATDGQNFSSDECDCLSRGNYFRTKRLCGKEDGVSKSIYFDIVCGHLFRRRQHLYGDEGNGRVGLSLAADCVLCGLDDGFICDH